MKTTKFQILIIAAFIVFIVVGVIFFATYKGSGGENNQIAPITIWGTFPASHFNAYVSALNQTRSESIRVTYTEKTPANFSQDFIAALARGQGPDAILIPSDMLLTHLDKVTPIPYSALPQRTFKDTFVEEGEMYLGPDGVRAIPFVIDPLIMYWNRDTFSSAGLATYPKNWGDFVGLVSKLTTKDENGNIRKSAIAMGDFSNVANARELLGTLILQMGNPITTASEGSVVSTLKTGPNPESALQFFTQFVNPTSNTYSWNRGMPNSKTAFLAGNLATYFGFASEIKDLQERNPNLNFDAAPMPQLSAGGIKTTYGKMYGLSVLKSSPVQNSVYQNFVTLVEPANIASLSNRMYLPSVRRDIIAQGSKDPYITIFNQVALIARSWIDVDPNKSYSIFSSMINSITSGAKTIRQALNDASDQYDVALRQAMQ